jgi:hypothetical protein
MTTATGLSRQTVLGIRENPARAVQQITEWGLYSRRQEGRAKPQLSS